MKRTRRLPEPRSEANCYCARFLLASLLGGTLVAQTDWRPLAIPTPRTELGAAADLQRGTTVWFGGYDGWQTLAETWEHGPSGLVLRQLPASPPARANHRLAYDSSRARIVLFGGRDQTGLELGDTWLYDGQTWTAAAAGPQPRQGHAMAYAPAEDSVLLFGGRRQQLLLADTWRWNGGQWLQLNPATAPTAREAAAAAASPQELILCGGRSSLGLLGDTWRFAAGSWSQLPTTVPPRADAGMAYATGSGLVLVGGEDSLGPRADCHRYAGGQWSAIQSSNPAPAAAAFGLAAAPGGTALLRFGGRDSLNEPQGGLWQLSGDDWAQLLPAAAPRGRLHHAATYDPLRQRAVVYGGNSLAGNELGDLWEWDGNDWRERQFTGLRPSARQFHALAYDPWRQACLLFGGSDAAGTRGDTWLWNGVGFTLLLPPQSPTPRKAHAMTATPEGVLLFGGNDAGFALLGDTWRFGPAGWAPVPGPGPSPRQLASMAYDARRDEVILLGGRTANSTLADTWRFANGSWQLRTPNAAPPPRFAASLAFAAERSRLVLHGGLDDSFAVRGDSWEWDGATWRQQTTANAPPSRAGSILVHHAAAEHTLLFGGSAPGAALGDSWLYRSENTASFHSFGVGCAGSAGVPRLAAAPGQRPWLGDVFELEIDQLPPQPGLVIVIYGFTDQVWNGQPLPRLLDSFGMPGCLAYLSADDPFLAFHSGQRLRFPFPLPAIAGFAGFVFFNQALVLDPGANNPLGAVMTNAGRAVLGLR